MPRARIEFAPRLHFALKTTEKIIQRNIFLTKEKETQVKRSSAFEQPRPVEHL